MVEKVRELQDEIVVFRRALNNNPNSSGEESMSEIKENLKKLKQAGSMRDYVKDFSSLMLDIQNMSEEDKLFNFMSGLQTWAQTELIRQVVKDIPMAMVAAEGLANFRANNATSTSEKKKSVDYKKGKSKKWKKVGDGKKKKGESTKGKDQHQNKTKKHPRMLYL
ncbi:hypothetical protein LWI28_023307 [Acer negundo]|uniref:Retrotransposon gag domain-containing protein n=1 Tax=Acer negundo TaxID=4023 RepID=A0AAD5JQG3_ACENE|nr:hypothetical protein LWI28_023307 [Acer negundo]